MEGYVWDNGFTAFIAAVERLIFGFGAPLGVEWVWPCFRPCFGLFLTSEDSWVILVFFDVSDGFGDSACFIGEFEASDVAA